MPYKLGDVYIGRYPIIQNFGEKPMIYNARYNIKGHNGIDFGLPAHTMILAAADGIVSETGFDNGAYGNYIEIRHEGYKTKYAHLNDIVIKKDDKVIRGQLIGHSNNTGNSDTPHLHFAVSPIDSAGNKTQTSNGYGGYIDPNGIECQWEVVGLTEPIIPEIDIAPMLPTDSAVLSIKSTHSNSFISVVMFGLQHGLPLDENGNFDADDPNAGKKINAWIASILESSSPAPVVAEIHTKPLVAAKKARGFFSLIGTKFWYFIFTQK